MPTIDPLGLPRCASCGNAFAQDRQADGTCHRCGGQFDAPRLTQPITFRAGEIAGELLPRAQGDRRLAGEIARRDLQRYYALLRQELATVQLTEAEASLVCDALNGTLLDEHTYRLVWAEVDDAIRLDRLDQKWAIDGPALIERLRAMTAGQTMALVDAVERFWHAPNEDQALRRAGLVRE